MKKLTALIPILLLLNYKQKGVNSSSSVKLNQIAAKYVTLGLTIGEYDSDFVITYYGPDSLKPHHAKAEFFPKDSLLKQVNDLQDSIKIIEMPADSNLNRAKWISAQLIAFNRRIKIFSGEFSSFDQESKDLFGVVAPVYKDSYYKNVLAKIDSLLPGKGTINDRFPILAKKFIIPYNKLDVVLKAAIAAARSQTLKI